MIIYSNNLEIIMYWYCWNYTSKLQLIIVCHNVERHLVLGTVNENCFYCQGQCTQHYQNKIRADAWLVV